MSIGQAFDNALEYYDNWMKKALPNYNDLFGTAKEIIPFDVDKSIKVLDLGAGTGLFSKHVFEKYPNAEFVLIDLAEKLLDSAKTRFKDYDDQFEFIVKDYRTIEGEEEYDLVISSLSIHHLTHEEKKKLFKSIYRILKHNGLFINVDQIRGETSYLSELYWNHWLEQIKNSGATEQQITESIARRKDYDIDATSAEQLQWLKEAGFINIDCVYKNFFVGVFFAMKV